VLSSNPKFNREKLKSFSTDYFAKAPMTRQVAAMRDYLSVNPESSLNRATDEQLAVVLKMNEGYRLLSEVDEKSRFLFTADDQIEYDPQAVEKVLVKNERQGAAALREVRDVLAGVADWSAHPLESAVTAFCEQKQLGLGKVAQPIRVAVSGSAVSPPIFEAIALLGRDATLARIDRCLSKLG
jgi:glutamyl-tRNA synthetase